MKHQGTRSLGDDRSQRGGAGRALRGVIGEVEIGSEENAVAQPARVGKGGPQLALSHRGRAGVARAVDVIAMVQPDEQVGPSLIAGSHIHQGEAQAAAMARRYPRSVGHVMPLGASVVHEKRV